MTTSHAALVLVLVAFVLGSGCTVPRVLGHRDAHLVATSLIDKIPPPTRDSTDPYRASRNARLAILPSKVDFGTVDVDDSIAQTVRIVSHYSFSVTVTRVSAQGVAFKIGSTTGPVELAPGGQHSVVVEFSPITAKRYRGSLVVELDASAARYIRVPVEGRGR